MFKFTEQKNEKTDYIIGGDWTELKKTWDKYNKAKDDQDDAKMEQFAKKINRLQDKLGIAKTIFS